MSSVITSGRVQMECARDFFRNLGGRFAGGGDGERGFAIEGKALVVEAGEVFSAASEGALTAFGGFVLEAAMPQLIDWGFEEDRWEGAKDLAVGFLGERSSAEGDYGVPGEIC